MSYIVKITTLQISTANRLYGCLSKDNWLYSSLSPRILSNSSPFTENWLFSIPLKTVYIVIFVPDNWLYESNSTEN